MAARKAFPLRMDPQLYEELRRWADAEYRSVNGQIEFLLKQAVRKRTNRKDGSRGESPGSDGSSSSE